MRGASILSTHYGRGWVVAGPPRTRGGTEQPVDTWCRRMGMQRRPHAKCRHGRAMRAERVVALTPNSRRRPPRGDRRVRWPHGKGRAGCATLLGTAGIAASRCACGGNAIFGNASPDSDVTLVTCRRGAGRNCEEGAEAVVGAAPRALRAVNQGRVGIKAVSWGITPRSGVRTGGGGPGGGGEVVVGPALLSRFRWHSRYCGVVESARGDGGDERTKQQLARGQRRRRQNHVIGDGDADDRWSRLFWLAAGG